MKKLDVLFIHPKNYKSLQSYLKLPSLEICQISAILNQFNYTNKLIDLFVEGVNIDDKKEDLLNIAPRIVLIYCTEYNHIEALRTAYYISQQYPSALVGMIGMIVTFIPKYLMKRYPYIDFVLLGNADYPVKEILDNNCNLSKCHDVNNMAFKVEDQVFINKMSYEYSLDSLPTSNRQLYDLKKYHFHSPETIVRSSRGCPSHCDFCNKRVYSPFLVESMPKFFAEIDVLLKNGFSQFFFSDDTFAFSQRRLDEFCEYYELNNYSFRWTSNLRICDITESRISKMKAHGAYRVFIGIETINKNACKLVHKEQNAIDIEERIEILKRNGIEFHASLIVGNPGDTTEDLDRTSEFIKRIQPTLATFNKIKVYPGTPIFDYPDKYGILAEDMMWFENPDWCNRALIYTDKLSTNDILEYSKKMMRDMLL